METRCTILDTFSKIDVLMGRIRRTGEWKMLRELTHILSRLVSTLKDLGLSYRSRIPTYIFMRVVKARKRERLSEVEAKIGKTYG